MEAHPRINRIAEVLTTLTGIGVIVLSALYLILGQVLRRSAIYITYFFGDLVSRTTMRFGFGYKVYSRLMLWSSELDTEDLLWKTPCKEHPEIEQASKHQCKKR